MFTVGLLLVCYHGVNASVTHKWLRDSRFASEDQAADLSAPEGATFLPVEVAGVAPVMVAPISQTSSTDPITAQRVDITLSDGRRILVEGATALPAIVALVEGLAQ